MVEVGHVPSRAQSDLTGVINSSDTFIPVTSTAGFTAPCAVLIGHRNAWHDPTVTYVPEIVWIAEVVDGQTLRTTVEDRGISGTSARGHDGTTDDLTVTAVFDQRHWERLRTELTGVARIERGNYTGDGTSDRTIALPFHPDFVVVSWSGQTAYSGTGIGASMGLYVAASGAVPSTDAADRPTLHIDGFIVSVQAGDSLNNTGTVYSYTAIGT